MLQGALFRDRTLFVSLVLAGRKQNKGSQEGEGLGERIQPRDKLNKGFVLQTYSLLVFCSP